MNGAALAIRSVGGALLYEFKGKELTRDMIIGTL